MIEKGVRWRLCGGNGPSTAALRHQTDAETRPLIWGSEGSVDGLLCFGKGAILQVRFQE